MGGDLIKLKCFSNIPKEMQRKRERERERKWKHVNERRES